MNTYKFDLNTHAGVDNFNRFARTAIADALFYAEDTHTGEDIADYVYANADSHDQGPKGYWGLFGAEHDFETLTNDPVAERAIFVAVGNQALTELRTPDTAELARLIAGAPQTVQQHDIQNRMRNKYETEEHDQDEVAPNPAGHFVAWLETDLGAIENDKLRDIARAYGL